MGTEYKTQITVGYFGTDNDLCLTPASLAIYFQDLAISHSNSLGFTLDFLASKKRGWAITNWHIEMIRYPLFGDILTINTWSNQCRRMQAQRSFRVTDSNGDIVCNASSRWIYMDLERRRPAKLEEGMEESYLCNLPSAIENEKYTMPKPEEEIIPLERQFTVTRRDTDTNGHANNTKYMEWAMDDVPDELYESRKIKEISAVYRKECYKGSKIVSKCFISDVEEGKQSLSIFYDQNDNSIVFAEIATLWVRLSHC